jgi:hypothetical protein
MEEVMNKTIRIMVLGLLGLTMVPVQATFLNKLGWLFATGASAFFAGRNGINFYNNPSASGLFWTASLSSATFLCARALFSKDELRSSERQSALSNDYKATMQQLS